MLLSPRKSTLQEFLSFSCMVHHFCRLRDPNAIEISQEVIGECIFKCVTSALEENAKTVIYNGLHDVLGSTVSGEVLRDNIYKSTQLFADRLRRKHTANFKAEYAQVSFSDDIACVNLQKAIKKMNYSFNRFTARSEEKKKIKLAQMKKEKEETVLAVKKERIVKKETDFFDSCSGMPEPDFMDLDSMFYDVSEQLMNSASRDGCQKITCHNETQSKRTTKKVDIHKSYAMPLVAQYTDAFSLLHYLKKNEKLSNSQITHILNFVKDDPACNCHVMNQILNEGESQTISFYDRHIIKRHVPSRSVVYKYIVVDLHEETIHATFNRHDIKWCNAVKFTMPLYTDEVDEKTGKTMPRTCFIVNEKDWCRLNVKWLCHFPKSTPLYPVWCKHIISRTSDPQFDEFRYYHVIKSILRSLDGKAAFNEQFIASPERNRHRFHVYDRLFFIIDKCVSFDASVSQDLVKDVHKVVQLHVPQNSIVQAVRDFILLEKLHVIEKKVVILFYDWFILGHHSSADLVAKNFCSLVRFMKNLYEYHVTVDTKYILFDNYSLLNRFDTRTVPLKANEDSILALISYYELCVSVLVDAEQCRTLFTGVGTINRKTLKNIITHFPLRENSRFLRDNKESRKREEEEALESLFSEEPILKKPRMKAKDVDIKPDFAKLRQMTKIETSRRRSYVKCINGNWEAVVNDKEHKNLYMDFQKTSYTFFYPFQMKKMYQKNELRPWWPTVIDSMEYFLAFVEFLAFDNGNAKLDDKLVNVQFGRSFYTESFIRKHDIHVNKSKSVNLNDTHRLSGVLSRRGCNSEWMRYNITTDEDIFLCNVKDEKDAEWFQENASEFDKTVAQLWYRLEGYIKRHYRETSDQKRKERSWEEG